MSANSERGDKTNGGKLADKLDFWWRKTNLGDKDQVSEFLLALTEHWPQMIAALRAPASAERATVPLRMLMFCPRCSKQHIDAPKDDWTNPPHATHTCQHCGLLWRPSNENTTGVAFIVAEEEKHRERIQASIPSSVARHEDQDWINGLRQAAAMSCQKCAATILAHIETHPDAPVPESTGWLIEMVSNDLTLWWSGGDKHPHEHFGEPHWTRDAFKAVRFTREQDALAVTEGWPHWLAAKVKVLGHLFIGDHVVASASGSWIPVGERLPGDGTIENVNDVLAVWTDKGAMEYNDTCPSQDVSAGIDVVSDFFIRAHANDGWFSHWSQLPERPGAADRASATK